MNLSTPPPRALVSFLTRNMSLAAWQRGGMLDRELAPFRRWLAQGWEVHLVGYGDGADLALAPAGIRVHANLRHLPIALYLRMLAWQLRGLRGRAVVRSNQVRGAERAASFARRLDLPFVARCGYLPSLFSEWEQGVDSRAAREDRELERKVFGAADQVIVSTAALAERVHQACGIPADRVNVVPNFVETDRFTPATGTAGPDRIVFVGRLEDQKNVSLLLKALSGSRYPLLVIGSGPLRESLEGEARACGVDAEFAGNLPHSELPRRLQEGTVFCLPSRHEGHPKALLEAMACGLPVVATEAPGISDLLIDGQTGLLSKPEPGPLRAALDRVMEDAALRRNLGGNARRFIEEHCTLEGSVERETTILNAAGTR